MGPPRINLHHCPVHWLRSGLSVWHSSEPGWEYIVDILIFYVVMLWSSLINPFTKVEAMSQWSWDIHVAGFTGQQNSAYHCHREMIVVCCGKMRTSFYKRWLAKQNKKHQKPQCGIDTMFPGHHHHSGGALGSLSQCWAGWHNMVGNRLQACIRIGPPIIVGKAWQKFTKIWLIWYVRTDKISKDFPEMFRLHQT